MNFEAVLNRLIQDTIGTGASLHLFSPELALCATILALLFVRRPGAAVAAW